MPPELLSSPQDLAARTLYYSATTPWIAHFCDVVYLRLRDWAGAERKRYPGLTPGLSCVAPLGLGRMHRAWEARWNWNQGGERSLSLRRTLDDNLRESGRRLRRPGGRSGIELVLKLLQDSLGEATLGAGVRASVRERSA